MEPNLALNDSIELLGRKIHSQLEIEGMKDLIAALHLYPMTVQEARHRELVVDHEAAGIPHMPLDDAHQLH